MVLVPRARSDRETGVWWRPVRYEGRLTAYVHCPKGHFIILSRHVIREDGTVTAPAGEKTDSVKCPFCGWDEYLKLEGWKFE